MTKLEVYDFDADETGDDSVKPFPSKKNIKDPEPERPPTFSDEALALRFAGQHKDQLRYVAAWGKWLICDGKQWQIDDTLKAFDFARKICRRAASECNKPKFATAIASAKTIAAVERLAKADRQ